MRQRTDLVGVDEAVVGLVEHAQVGAFDREHDTAVVGVAVAGPHPPLCLEQHVEQEQGVAGLGGDAGLAGDRGVGALVAVEERVRHEHDLVVHVEPDRQPFGVGHLVEEQGAAAVLSRRRSRSFAPDDGGRYFSG